MRLKKLDYLELPASADIIYYLFFFFFLSCSPASRGDDGSCRPDKAEQTQFMSHMVGGQASCYTLCDIVQG
jgi:hypothetical protein